MQTTEVHEGARVQSAADDSAYRAYQLLHFGFVVAPLVAGLDKFAELLVDWEIYLAPFFADLLPFSAEVFMGLVGVVEVVAALVVAFKPRIGGYLVSAWLSAIILNLLVSGDYYDIALRDLGLAIGAFALALLAERYAAE